MEIHLDCFCLSVFSAAVVEGTIFCAHAGLSPQLYDLDLVSLCLVLPSFLAF